MGLLLSLFFITQSCSKNDEPSNVDDRKKVGVFGGSISANPESETAKNVWKENLKINITTCGVGGAGFSSLTNNNVPSQIEKSEVFDIYILWASTNDATKGTVGDLNTTDDTTQSGGILKSLEIIKQKNSNALILFFTSLPRFDSDINYNKIRYFVDNQIAICEKEHIPYLDLYRLCKFDKNNCSEYYFPDMIHLNNIGYAQIATMQMEFIYKNMKKFYHEKT